MRDAGPHPNLEQTFQRPGLCEERGIEMGSHHPGYDFSSRRDTQPYPLKVVLIVSIATVVGMVAIPMVSVSLSDFHSGGSVFADELDRRHDEWTDLDSQSLRDRVARDLLPRIDPALVREYKQGSAADRRAMLERFRSLVPRSLGFRGADDRLRLRPAEPVDRDGEPGAAPARSQPAAARNTLSWSFL